MIENAEKVHDGKLLVEFVKELLTESANERVDFAEAQKLVEEVQRDDELKAKLAVILENQSKSNGNIMRHAVSAHVLSTVADVIAADSLLELEDGIRLDVVHNYGMKYEDIDAQALRRFALIAYTVNSLTEAARQTSHKVVPVLGGGLTETMLNIALEQIQNREVLLAMKIVQHRAERLAEQGENGGDQGVG